MQKERVYYYLARILSYIFHPLLMSTYAVFVLFNSGHYLSVVNAEARHLIFSIYFIITFLLPALFIPVLYYFGMISKLEIDNRKERLLPLLTVVVMYSLAWHFMGRINMPPLLLKIIISSLVSVSISLLVTLFWKMSLHSLGMGGLLAFVFYLANFENLSVLLIGFIVILFSGLVGASRLYLKRHNPTQVYVGYFLGFASVYLSMIIF
jgi:membrane-associated phospholipid phosphatase